MSVTSQTILDGERLFIGKYTNIADAEAAAVLKIDVSGLNKNSHGYTCNGVKINKIWAQTAGIGVDILWDADTDLIAVSIPANELYKIDYSCFGGIPNNAGTGITGDVNFITVGTASATTRYTIILECVKTYTTN